MGFCRVEVVLKDWPDLLEYLLYFFISVDGFHLAIFLKLPDYAEGLLSICSKSFPNDLRSIITAILTL